MQESGELYMLNLVYKIFGFSRYPRLNGPEWGKKASSETAQTSGTGNSLLCWHLFSKAEKGTQTEKENEK